MTPREKVTRYIELAEIHQQVDLDELVNLLTCDAIDAEDAECLIAFVPMAFAREILTPLGVGLPTDYLVRNFDTGTSVRGRLDAEPIFVAAKVMAGEMLAAGHTNQRALDIAAFSAEMSVVRELSLDDSSMKDVVLTEPVLARLPVTHIKQKFAGFRWKF